MDRDFVYRLALKAQGESVSEGMWMMHISDLERFAMLVASVERESCAKVCEKQGRNQKAMQHHSPVAYTGAAHDCANAIRKKNG